MSTKNLLTLGPKLTPDEWTILKNLIIHQPQNYGKSGWTGFRECPKPEPHLLLEPLDKVLKSARFWMRRTPVYDGERSLLTKLEELNEQRSGSGAPAQAEKGRTPRSKRRSQSSP